MIAKLKKTLSFIMAVSILLGLVPLQVQAAEYTKAGEVGAVTAECAPITAPTLGGEVTNGFFITVTSPTDKGVLNPTGDDVRWQRKTGDTWMDYKEASFDEGTYRLCIRLTSNARSNGNYYALVQSTTLTVNGTLFTPGEAPPESKYQIWGNASMSFYSQEYTVAKETGTYLVTVTCGTSGNVYADKVYGRTGEVVTLTAEPFSGYRLKEWRVVSGGVTVENNRFTIGTEDVEIRAIFESTNENLGDITLIEATGEEGADYRPIMGRTAKPIIVTLSSEPQDDSLYVSGYGYGMWEVKNPDGSWEFFVNKPFTYGTYRISISLRNGVEDGKYHALTEDTVLTLNGVEFTLKPGSLTTYYSISDGYAFIGFIGPEMEVIPTLEVYDGTPVGCHVVPTLGEFTVPMGDDFSFTIEPDDHYELTDPDALVVEVNEEIVTPDANGVYTVSTEDADGVNIYAGGSAFTGYSNFIISAGSTSITEKVYVGDSYTFETLSAIGAAVPAGSSFTGWKLGGKTYQPGDTYEVRGTADIRVEAVFSGLHNITVIGSKAYADESHTQPISAAAEGAKVYIAADPAPEGKVFSYWQWEAETPGHYSWSCIYDSGSPSTWFTVSTCDITWTPVYETMVDEIVINGMTKPTPGAAIDNSDYSYKWGCSVPANSGYSLGISYWYDITEGEPELAMSSGDVFRVGHTYRFRARIHLGSGHIYPADAKDISVILADIDAEDYEWTISEIGYSSATIYFEFTCKREKTDTSYIRPEGRGTASEPFLITNVGELYWFAAFVNGTITASDISINNNEACARVMNDITVNGDLLTADYALNEADTSLLAPWEPIADRYKGTFDGNDYTISGIYCAPQAAEDYRYGGFFRSLSSGRSAAGSVRDLTLKDSYFCAPAKNSGYMGAFAGYVSSQCTVENCHFDGTVTTAITADSPNKENYQYVHIGGIAGDVAGEIRDCTARGLISGYGSEMGGIASSMYKGKVIGCVNEATVENSCSGDTGGIVGKMAYSGTVRDCCNKGNVIGRSSAGIVGNVENNDGEVIRCWNEGDIRGYYTSGIVGSLKGTVKNCYNAGSAYYAGIVGTPQNGSSITYCHNVGSITDGSDASIIGYTRNSCTVSNCYYLEESETDSLDGTTCKTAAQFADGTVFGLLDNGNEGVWVQGESWPQLAECILEFVWEGSKCTVTAINLPEDALVILCAYTGDFMTDIAYLDEDIPSAELSGTEVKVFFIDGEDLILIRTVRSAPKK